jgi:ATP-dependent protease ClpP protease subunit
MKQKQIPTKVDLDDEDNELFADGKQLGYFFREQRSSSYTFYLNEPIKEPSYYSGLCNVFFNASPDDEIQMVVNSPGGRMDGMLTILDAIARTPAKTIAVLQGTCASAASFIALACDEIDVGPHASMLCHVTRGGLGGKTPDMFSAVQHLAQETEDVVRTYYSDFLTEEEIESLLQGREIYLLRADIIERLKNRMQLEIEAMQALQEYQGVEDLPWPEIEDPEVLEEPQPKRKTKK